MVAIRRRKDHEQPEAELVRWGLIPHWAKDTRGAAKMINAKAETLLDRPAFRARAHARELGKQGQGHVREHLLLPRLLADELRLYQSVLN